MKRTKRAAFTAAALLSCTLAFSGCSLISQVVPDQDGTAGEEAGADGQQTNGQQADGQQQPNGESGAAQDSDATASGSGSSSSTEGASGAETGTTGSDSGAAGADNGSTGSDSEQSSGSQAEVSIGKSFEDPEMQDKIEVLSAVRNFDSAKKATAVELGGEVVLLEVKITPGQKYGGLIQSGAFKISDDGGADYRYDQTSGVEAEMKAAGYEPFEDVSRRDGGTHQGWIAYVPDEKQDTYKIRYERRAGKVIGTDEKVPEFTTTFDIPAA